MASLALGLGGAALGSLAPAGFSFLGLSGASLGWMLGSTAGSLLFAPDQPDIEGPRLSDKGVTLSSYGADIPQVFGMTTVSGNVFWSTDKKERKTTRSAGKGSLMGGGGSATGYSYSVSLAVSLCSSEIGDVLKIWADGNLIFDKTSATEDLSSPDLDFRVYKGTEDQLPDSVMVAEVGADTCPAYRGTAYIVFEDFELGSYGQRIPQLRFLVAGSTTEITPSLQISDTAVPTTNDSEHVYRDDLGLYLYRDGETIRRLDPSTMEVLWTLEKGLTALFLIDDLGRFYARDTTSLQLRDARTGTLITQYTPSSADVVRSVGSAAVLDLTPHGGRKVIVCADNFNDIIKIFDAETLQYYASGASFWPYHQYQGVRLVPDDDLNIWGVVWYYGQEGTRVVKILRDDIIRAVNQYLAAVPPAPQSFAHTEFPLSLEEIAGPLSAQTTSLHVFPLYWNSANGTLVCLTNNAIAELDVTEEKFISRQYILGGGDSRYASDGNNSWLSGDPRRGYVFISLVNGGAWINTKTWERTTLDLSVGNPWGLDYDPTYAEGKRYAIDYPARAIMGTFGLLKTGAVWKIFAERASGGRADLAAITGDLLGQAGLEPADYDLSALTGMTVAGVNFATMARCRDMLPVLQKAYLFDLVESDFQLVAILRGGSGATVIPKDDLISDGGIQSFRKQEVELPEVVNLKFVDADRDYEISGTSARRIANPDPAMHSRAQSEYTSPLVLSPEEARQLADTMLFANWAERESLKIGLPWQYLAEDPSNVIFLDLASGRKQCRIDKMDVGANMLLQLDLTVVDDGSYSSAKAADGGSGYQASALQIAPPVVLNILDIPLLRDGDNPADGSVFVYGALGCSSPGFRGADIYRKQTDGNWIPIAAAAKAASYGIASSALGYAPADLLDTTNALTLSMIDGGENLTSATPAVLLDGTSNALLVGDEILQFANVTLNADGTYTLDTFYRGRRGTEGARRTHTSGERVFVLDTALFAIPLSTEDLGSIVQLQAVHWGAAAGYEITHAVEGAALKPYAPAHFKITDPVTNTVTSLDLSWVRRNRINGAWEDGYGEIPNSEASETYQIDITFGGVTVMKAISDATTFRYSLTDFTADFAEAAFVTGITFDLYQISAVAGRGFAATEIY